MLNTEFRKHYRSNIMGTDGKVKRSYRKWSSMIRRCTDTTHPAWKYYGGRGITVCDRWLGSHRVEGYLNFVADLGEPPLGLTLERIDNSKGYGPENCCWATWKQQAANRRRCGKQIDPTCLRQKAIAAGLPYHVVWLRVNRHFWPLEKALATPVLHRGRQDGQCPTAGLGPRQLPIPA